MSGVENDSGVEQPDVTGSVEAPPGRSAGTDMTGQSTAGDAANAGEGTADAGSGGAAVAETDRDAVHRQLGRLPRGEFTVAHRCSCGLPDVVQTPPLLEDGTPFPTTFYVTCPRAASKVGTLESSGMMRDMTERLVADPELAEAYREAHEDYLRRRAELGEAPQLEGISAGGMPERVKCLHVLLGHSLAAGSGVNPLGDEVVAALGDYGAVGPCVGCGDDPE